MTISQREDVSLHIPLVSMLRWALRPNVIMRHVPNGEYRDPRAGAKLKAMGTLAGSADLEFHWRDGTGRRMLHLELKVEGRQPSLAQVEFAFAVRALGDEYHVARTIDEALTILRVHGLLNPKVKVGNPP